MALVFILKGFGNKALIDFDSEIYVNGEINWCDVNTVDGDGGLICFWEKNMIKEYSIHKENRWIFEGFNRIGILLPIK